MQGRGMGLLGAMRFDRRNFYWKRMLDGAASMGRWKVRWNGGGLTARVQGGMEGEVKTRLTDQKMIPGASG
jgi:hypothetical protein